MGLIQTMYVFCSLLESENCDNGFEHWHSLWSNSKLLGLCQMDWWLHDVPLPETNSEFTPENGPKRPQKETTKVFQPSIFQVQNC